MEAEPLYTAQGNPYWSPKNLVHGEARVFWGSQRFFDLPDGWWTPCGFTRDPAEAQRIVKRMAELMKPKSVAAHSADNRR